MHDEPEHGSGRDTGISRRQILRGAAVAAVVAAAPKGLLASQEAKRGSAEGKINKSSSPRNMGAAAIMRDGRILVTGGYDRPWTEKSAPRALRSAAIFDPQTGEWQPAASMRSARARHAIAALPDGRVMVTGGFARSATSSVEIYDPATDRWEFGPALTQPRYDHVAVATGEGVYVMGGSSQSMLSSVELVQPRVSRIDP